MTNKESGIELVFKGIELFDSLSTNHLPIFGAKHSISCYNSELKTLGFRLQDLALRGVDCKSPDGRSERNPMIETPNYWPKHAETSTPNL